MAKRIFLFILTNILVITTISIVLRIFNVGSYLTQYGLDYGQLAFFCLIWGMGGAFISLLLSKWMAKMMMRVKIIDPDQATGHEMQLVQTVHRLAHAAGLDKMPEVGIYNSPDPNAFATGATKNSSLVAVSTGLLQNMDKNAIEGVLGHEVAHIANGDMVTMTLIQGVVNAFVMFLARVLAYAIASVLRERDSKGGYGIQFLLIIVFQILFSILGSLVVAWFSRWREFRADHGGANLAGREKMIKALQSLQQTQRLLEHADDQPAFASLKISNKKGWARMFSTHPPLEERIERLQENFI